MKRLLLAALLIIAPSLVWAQAPSGACTRGPSDNVVAVAGHIYTCVSGTWTDVFSGASTGTNTGDQTTVSGNAGTATKLATARAINGVNFDGSAPITVTADASTLTSATLAAGVTASSLTSFGAAATFNTSGSIQSSGTAGVGYATGAGGAVTQLTSKSTTAPQINKPCGLITMNGAALAASAIVTFVVPDTVVGANDMVMVTHDSVGTLGAYYVFANTNIAATSFQITVKNISAGSLSEAIKIRFCIIKGAVS